jgi:hypothetical protein
VVKFALWSINVLTRFWIRRNCLRSGRCQSQYQSIKRVIEQIVIFKKAFVNHVQNFFQHLSVKVNSIYRGNFWDHQCGFWSNRSTIDNIFCICQILEKILEYNEAVCQLFVDFEKVYDSVRREVLYNILIEFSIPIKMVRLIEMCVKNTYE